MNSDSIKSIYLIAICGTGMASLAGLLKAAGYQVTGSDSNVYPPMSTLLAETGIEIQPGYKKENITGAIDLVIVGNVVSRTNEEVQAVLDAGIPYASFPEAVARFFLTGRKSLVVAGTHGKTTTASLLSWTLHAAGREPGFMVGGWLKNFDLNYRVPGGDFFVTEGDEYDTAFFDKEAKFLHYRPFGSILTGIEFDHADIFRDLEHIKSSFKKFVDLIPAEGLLLAKYGDRNVTDVLEGVRCRVETYGLEKGADWTIDDHRFENGSAHFTLYKKEKAIGPFSLPMTGRHNVENAVAVAALAMGMGLSAEEVGEGFKRFRGIKRRQEVVGEKNGITVIDDFAHHPTAIDLTLEGIKTAYPGQKVWALFEPRSATSRRNVFQNDFPESFAHADEVILAGLFSPDKIPEEERLDPAKVVEDIREKGGQAHFIPKADDIVEFVAENGNRGDVILVMSCGGFDGIHEKLLRRL